MFNTRGAEIFAAICADAEQAGRLSMTFDEVYTTQNVVAFHGVVSALDRLTELGFRVGLVSSKASSRMTRDLACAGLADRFAVVVSGDDVERAKPYPEGVLRAIATLHVDPRDVVMVGDTSADLDAGAAAGVRTVHAGWGYGTPSLAETADAAAASPDRLVATVLDLLSAPA